MSRHAARGLWCALSSFELLVGLPLLLVAMPLLHLVTSGAGFSISAIRISISDQDTIHRQLEYLAVTTFGLSKLCLAEAEGTGATSDEMVGATSSLGGLSLDSCRGVQLFILLGYLWILRYCPC